MPSHRSWCAATPLGRSGKERRQRSQDLGAALRVRHHGAALLGGELRLLVEDVGERPVELADVVEERDSLDAAQSALVQTGGFAEYQCVGRDAADVRAGDGVVGVDGVEQRLERGRAKPLGLRPHAVLAVEQSAGGGGLRLRAGRSLSLPTRFARTVHPGVTFTHDSGTGEREGRAAVGFGGIRGSIARM